MNPLILTLLSGAACIRELFAGILTIEGRQKPAPSLIKVAAQPIRCSLRQ